MLFAHTCIKLIELVNLLSTASHLHSNLIVSYPINIATVTTTPTTTGYITTYPPPELLYAKTTDYHWPRFEQEMSDMTGKYDSKGEGLSDGPFGFGKSVKLKAGVEGEEDEVTKTKGTFYYKCEQLTE